MDGRNVRRALFLVLFLGLFLLVARLFYPFLTVLLWSGLLYVLFVPLFERITREKGTKPIRPAVRHLVAGLFSIAGVLLIVVPLSFLAVNVFKQAGDITKTIVQAVETHPEWLDLSPSGTAGGFVSRITDGAVDLSAVDIRGELLGLLGGSAESIIGISGAILRNAASFAITLAFMVFTLYFFFVDGGHLIKILVGSIPIEPSYTRLFIRTLRDTSRHLVRGYVLVALYQGLAAFALFSLFGVKGPLVLGLLTSICSFIPMVGAGLVWLPVGLVHLGTHGLVGGIALLGLSAVFISLMDNFLRPLFLRESLNVHPLLIFFSILGGLRLFGFNGIILGPLILILFFAALELYDRIYRKSEPRADGRMEDGINENPDGAGDGTEE